VGFASEYLKKEIKKQFSEIQKKLDHDVDCIVGDLRKGQGAGLGKDIDKVMKYIVEAEKAIPYIEFARENAHRIKRSTDNSVKAAEATEKASVIGSALNPAAAAIGFATSFIKAVLKKEAKDLEDVINVVPAITGNFKGFLKRSKGKIIAALAEKALKDKNIENRTNMVG